MRPLRRCAAAREMLPREDPGPGGAYGLEQDHLPVSLVMLQGPTGLDGTADQCCHSESACEPRYGARSVAGRGAPTSDRAATAYLVMQELAALTSRPRLSTVSRTRMNHFYFYRGPA